MLPQHMQDGLYSSHPAIAQLVEHLTVESPSSSQMEPNILQLPRTAAKQTAEHMIDAATSERPTAREERGGCKGGSPSLEVCPGEEVRGNPETRGFSRKCRTAFFSQFFLLEFAMRVAAAKQSKRQLPGLQQAKKKLTGPQQSK